MGLKSESKTINGHKYEVTQLPYTPGKRLLVRLYKVFAPALAQGLAGVPELKDQSIGDLQVSTIAPAFSRAVEQLARDLSEEDFDAMVEALAEYTFLVNDQGHKRQLSADEREFLFAGNYLELFQWLGFALRVNYAGFLKGRDLAADLARLQTLKASQSPPA